MTSLASTNVFDTWISSPIGQWAQQYINLGFAVFPCHGIINNKCTCGEDNCTNQGKHPATKHGLKDASKDIAIVASMFKYRGDYNIAIATGLISEIFVVDIDNNAEVSGDDTLRSLASDGKGLPQTLTSLTGNGRHLFFNYPDFEVGNRAKIMHQIDIRGTGGYVIAPPSHHKSGRDYEFDTSNGNDIVDAPDWLLEMLKPKPKEVHVKIYDTHHDKPELNEAISALHYIPAENYQTWVDMGMCLRDCFGSAGFNAWDAWSSTSSKYNANEMRKKWDSFKNTGLTIATLFDQARLAGWRPAPVHHEVIDTSMVDGFVSHIKKPLLEVRIDFDPMDMPGLIGDTVRWIVKSALQPQPMLAFLNVIAFAGSVFGRRYASPYDTRTNVYMVGVAETGAGKDYSRKMVGKLAEAAGLSQFLGGHSIRSDTGMVRGLSVNCSQLLMLDEFGKLLQALTDKGSSSYHKSIVKVLMSLYSDSSGVYNHGDYANPKINQTIVINRPNLCIYGTTTESEYIKGLHRDAVLSGELNRVIAIKVEPVDPRRLNTIPKMDNDLLLEWKRHAPSATNTISLASQPPEPMIVEWGDCDDLQWSIRQDQERIGSADLQTKALWHRRHENIIKVAMILAIARDKSFPRFETEDFDIAKQVVDASIKYMSNLVGENMSESVYEEQQQEIKAFIKKHPKGVDRTMLSQRFRKIEKRKREEIMADMITLGLLRVEASEGKRQTYFVI